MEAELASLGFPVIAISPDRPEQMLQSLEVEDLGYTVTSDSALEAARAFGIAFQLADEQVAQYRGYGIDLEQASGRDHHQLPVPSVFLVEPGGRIGWVYSNPDYTVRPDNAELLAAARALAEPGATRGR